MEIIVHKLGEGRELTTISISDNFCTHSFEFYTHPDWSIECMRQIIEDAFLNECRKEDRKQWSH